MGMVKRRWLGGIFREGRQLIFETVILPALRNLANLPLVSAL